MLNPTISMSCPRIEWDSCHFPIQNPSKSHMPGLFSQAASKEPNPETLVFGAGVRLAEKCRRGFAEPWEKPMEKSRKTMGKPMKPQEKA